MRKVFTVVLIFGLLALVSCQKENTEELTIANDSKELFLEKKIEKEKIDIDISDARIVAGIFSNQQNANTRSALLTNEKQIDNIFKYNDENGKTLMYIINYKDEKGFIIVSATKKYYPVIAYSDNGSYNVKESILNGSSILLEEYKNIMRKNENEPDSTINKYRQKWALYEETNNVAMRSLSDYEMSLKKEEQRIIWTNKGYDAHDLGAIRHYFSTEEAEGYIRDICNHTEPNYDCEKVNLLLIKRYPTETFGPFLRTEWHQGAPFNIDAPNGVAGCVPIAIAQIVRYHEWPTTYNWSLIPYAPSSSGTSELHRFILDIRNFANVTYKDEGTGASMNDAKKAFQRLQYSPSLIDYKRSETIHEIKNNRPVFMGGDRVSEFFGLMRKGHTWVCDGYKKNRTQYAALVWGNELFHPGLPIKPEYVFFDGTNDVTEFLHMNWGWGDKSGNGWYIFDNIYNSVKDRNYIYNREIIKVTPNK